jgi:hypothetical protein
VKLYILQVLIALDQLCNAVFGGWADETLSSRAWREMPCMAKAIDLLLWFDKDHCFESYVSEQLRMQMPPSLRNENRTLETLPHA